MKKSSSMEMSSFGSVANSEQPRGSFKSIAKYETPENRKRKFTSLSDSLGTPVQNRAYETHGVRFVPAEVLFYNAFRGQHYTTVITIFNISAHMMHLAISQPYSSAFHIKDDGTSIAIAPGLSISRKISYKCSEGKLFDSVIPIRIGHSLILLPVKVIPGQVHVTVEPAFVNFGRIDLGSAFVTKSVQLRNKGSISAKFTIDLSKNELDIMIQPRSGTIKPYSTVDIRIQLAGLVVGEHETEFWVKTTPPCRFTVWVTVVVPFLKAIHPFTTDEFTLLDMQATFPGTYRYSTLLVRNVSSDMSSVVVLCEYDSTVMSPAIAAREDPCFQHFRLYPSDGTLTPFENRIFTMWFSPREVEHERGWKRLLKKESTSQYLCFFRIQRVTVTHSDEGESQTGQIISGEKKCQLTAGREFSEDEPTISTKTMNSLDTKEKNNIIRVCAYATSVTPRLHIVPDELIFENVKIGQKIDKVLRVRNPCELPLGFSYVKQAHISLKQEPTFIEPNKSVEILVQLHPRSLKFEQKRLVFNLLSHKNLTDQSNVVVIGQVSIRLTITIQSEAKALVPVFLPGITPRVHPEGEEVGFYTETVLFNPKNTDIPNAVVWPKSQVNKPWLSSKARVAFPNERRRSLRVTAHDGNVRSIFTGNTRYNVPPDSTNVYSPKELEFKTQHDAKYRSYVSEQASKKVKYFKMLELEQALPKEYDIDDDKLYSLLGTFPPVPIPEFKLPERPVDHDVLCPLTPLQLFNIKVQPQVVDFGKMPPKTDCSTNIAVDNMNGFPIAVRFRTYKESLKVPEGAFIVPGNSTKVQKITLFLETNGKHYTCCESGMLIYHFAMMAWTVSITGVKSKIFPISLDDPDEWIPLEPPNITDDDEYWHTYSRQAEAVGLLFAGGSEFPWVVDIRLASTDQELWAVGNLITYYHVITTCRAMWRFVLNYPWDFDNPNKNIIKHNGVEADVNFCSRYLWESYEGRDLKNREVDETDFPHLAGYENVDRGGTRRVEGISFHPKWQPNSFDFDVSVVQMKKGIPPKIPKISYLPMPENPSTGEIVEPDFAQQEEKRWVCFIASFGKNSNNLRNNMANDYKVKYRVYFMGWDKCTEYLSRLCSRTHKFCTGRSFAPLLCFRTHAKVGAVCDHDIGAPLVCNGFVFGIVVRGVDFQLCNNLTPFPAIVKKTDFLRQYFADLIVELHLLDTKSGGATVNSKSVWTLFILMSFIHV